MEAAYFKAAIPEPFRILGLTLKLLSLGRYRLLKRFGCAFVADGSEEPTLSDLVIGVLICSMTCQEFKDFIAEPNCLNEIKAWGEKLGEFDCREKFKLFAEYVVLGSKIPDYWDEESDGKVSAANWSQCVEAVLRGQLGWSGQEIDEEPLTKALSDYFKWAESQGLVTLMTAEDIARTSELALAPSKAEIQGPELAAIAHVLGVMDGQSQMEDGKGGARGA
jgi:hypothetical protein